MIKQESPTSLFNRIIVWDFQAHDVYLFFVSLLGLSIVADGLYRFPSYTPKHIFLILAFMAIIAQTANTSVTVSNKAGITFEVGTAVAAAAIPFFGPSAAALIVALSSISIWVIKSKDKKTWKKSWRQLSFNTGMWSIALFVSGIVYQYLETWLGVNTILGIILPWIALGILNDQLNIWLLLGIVRLQHGKKVDLIEMWCDNRWAAGINILIISVGGGFLAFAIMQYGWVGTIVFFLPIILSAYAFALYVRQMQAHMDNLENIIEERTKKLKEVMKEKDQFLAVLSHDMKTPLTTAKLYASMIRDYPQAVIKKPHLAQIIVESQNTLTDMVNNILDLEKLKAGEPILLEKENFDIGALIETVIEPLNAQAHAKKIDLQYQIDAAPLLVNADQSQIKRVLQNLVSNAIKYTPEEGSVCVHANLKDHALVIEVKDNGYGIPVEELPYIFDRYRRVAKHKKLAGGTGLGLAITKSIVETHGGSVSVISTEDRGSTFTVILPV